MKPSAANTPPGTGPQTARPSGRRLLVLAPALVLLGAGLSGLWFKYGKPAADSHSSEPRLSRNTLDLLQHLNSPVEIRFYSVLPPGGAPESLQDFSRRVDQLLAAFQTVNDRQIHVTRNLSASGADAAAADGLRPFNLEKGEACFLGLTVVSGSQKAFLARLQPEWEPALEFDLDRAILQVTASSAAPVAPESAPISPEITNDIVRLIPDVKTTSLEDGNGILSEAAVREIITAGAEAENQINLAKQKLAEAQTGGSEADQQAAMKHLQQVQLEQTQKLNEIATRLKTELGVFGQMKAAASAADNR
jgi:hypothetical protein